MELTQILHLGYCDLDRNGRRNAVEVEVNVAAEPPTHVRRTIDLAPASSPIYTVSISGFIWNPRHTDVECGGQCQDTIRALFPDDPHVRMLCDLWDRWHLNALKAGTRVQKAALDAYRAGRRATDPEWEYPRLDHYTACCAVLRDLGLYEDRGYRYGHEWLIEPLTDEGRDAIVAICAAFTATPS